VRESAAETARLARSLREVAQPLALPQAVSHGGVGIPLLAARPPRQVSPDDSDRPRFTPTTMEAAENQVGEAVAHEVRGVPDACPACEREAVALAQRAMVEEREAVNGTDRPFVLFRFQMVDAVPAEPLLQRTDVLPAGPPIRACRAAHVGARDGLEAPFACLELVALAAGDPEPRVAIELRQDPLEEVLLERDVRIELDED